MEVIIEAIPVKTKGGVKSDNPIVHFQKIVSEKGEITGFFFDPRVRHGNVVQLENYEIPDKFKEKNDKYMLKEEYKDYLFFKYSVEEFDEDEEDYISFETIIAIKNPYTLSIETIRKTISGFGIIFSDYSTLIMSERGEL